MTSLAQWKRRCISAEERAHAAERRAHRSSTRLTTLKECLIEMTELRDESFQLSAMLKATLRDQAKHHLGARASEDDVEKLVAMWIDTTVRRLKSRKPEKPPIEITMQFRLTNEEFFRRMGFLPPEDDFE